MTAKMARMMSKMLSTQCSKKMVMLTWACLRAMARKRGTMKRIICEDECPHWKDDSSEENAQDVPNAHVSTMLERQVGPLTPFDVEDNVVTIDDDQLLVAQGLVVQEDEDEDEEL